MLKIFKLSRLTHLMYKQSHDIFLTTETILKGINPISLLKIFLHIFAYLI